jgi:hypothetical protein
MNRSEVMIAAGLREEVGIAGRAHRQREAQARPVRYPLPSHHATVTRRLAGMPTGWSARVLVLRMPNGSVEIYAPLLAYMRDYPLRSATWQNQVSRALGLFWDYSRAAASNAMGKSGIAILQAHFRAFALALRTGTITDGRDALGLYWPSSKRSVVRRTVMRIEEFAKWCERGSAAARDLNPTRPPDDALTFTDLLVWSRLRGILTLKHLATEARLVRRPSVVDLGPATKGYGLEPVKSFPLEDAERLIWEGHRRPGAKSTADGFDQYNVRDQMMALLDGWGGLRQSEGLHLWIDDVVEHPDKAGHAVVVLHHPSESMVDYPDPITRGWAHASRAEVLARLYGLRPRNEVMRGRYHVGWKGMDLDGNHRAVVHWLDDGAAALFWTLYKYYLRFVRAPLMKRRRSQGGGDHPFLLVSESADRGPRGIGLVGSPYSVQAYERNHRAAVLRLGLPYGKKRGTTTHGLRHMYGRALAELRLSPGIIRKAMHHVSHLSQLVYVAPDNATTDARLREAWDRVDAGRLGLPPVDLEKGALDPNALADDTTRALLRLRVNFENGGGLA